jgi:hypothetical protein
MKDEPERRDLMAEQPHQPPPSVRTERGSATPYPEIASSSGDVFQVMSLDLTFTSGLGVFADQPDTDRPSEMSCMVSCFGVNFIATVRFAGTGAWKIGWVQTVESTDCWILYRGGGRAARYRTRLPGRMRDGDASKGCWYGDESREKAKPGTLAHLDLMDDPNLPFHYPRHPGGPGLEALADLAPAGCGGHKEFWTWLVAIRDNAAYQPPNVVYLHHMHWKVVFDGVIHGGPDKPTITFPDGGGVILLSEGVRQGGATPVFAGPEVVQPDEEHSVGSLPDGQPQ